MNVQVRRSACRALFAAIVALAPLPAYGQSPRELVKARAWYDEGVQHEQRGEWAAALERFERALAVKSTPQLELHAGICREELGRLLAARAAYERARDVARAGGPATVVKVAEERLVALRGKLPAIEIVLASRYAGLDVSLDGRRLAVAELGVSVPVDPGKHAIAVSAADHEPHSEVVEVVEGDRKRVPIALRALARAPADEPSAVPAYLAIGGGLAAVTAGVVMIAASVAIDSDIDEQCGGADRRLCPPHLQEPIEADVATVNELRAGGIVLGAAGVVAGSLGAYLLVRTPGTDESSVALAPSLAPGGIALAGTF